MKKQKFWFNSPFLILTLAVGFIFLSNCKKTEGDDSAAIAAVAMAATSGGGSSCSLSGGGSTVDVAFVNATTTSQAVKFTCNYGICFGIVLVTGLADSDTVVLTNTAGDIAPSPTLFLDTTCPIDISSTQVTTEVNETNNADNNVYAYTGTAIDYSMMIMATEPTPDLTVQIVP